MSCVHVCMALHASLPLSSSSCRFVGTGASVVVVVGSWWICIPTVWAITICRYIQIGWPGTSQGCADRARLHMYVGIYQLRGTVVPRVVAYPMHCERQPMESDRTRNHGREFLVTGASFLPLLYH